MLFDRSDLYEVVSEGKKTNEMSVKESYISAAIENYIDTVLEDAINDDFLIEGKIYSVNNFKLNIHNLINPSNFKTGKNLPEMRRNCEKIYSNSNDLKNLKYVRDQLPHIVLRIDTYLKNKSDKLSSEETKNYKEQRNWIENRLLPLIERRIKELENKKNIKKESFINLDIFDDFNW